LMIHARHVARHARSLEGFLAATLTLYKVMRHPTLLTIAELFLKFVLTRFS
jgi:hypothetical protein